MPESLIDHIRRHTTLAPNDAARATAPDCRTRRRCPIPDDPCGPGGPRPYCWAADPTPGEDVYRAAAREKAMGVFTDVGLEPPTGDELESLITPVAALPSNRAGWDAAYAARQPEIDRLNARISALEFQVQGTQAQRDEAYAAGREAAAQAVLDWAAKHVAWDDGLTAEMAEVARGGR